MENPTNKTPAGATLAAACDGLAEINGRLYELADLLDSGAREWREEIESVARLASRIGADVEKATALAQANAAKLDAIEAELEALTDDDCEWDAGTLSDFVEVLRNKLSQEGGRA